MQVNVTLIPWENSEVFLYQAQAYLTLNAYILIRAPRLLGAFMPHYTSLGRFAVANTLYGQKFVDTWSSHPSYTVYAFWTFCFSFISLLLFAFIISSRTLGRLFTRHRKQWILGWGQRFVQVTQIFTHQCCLCAQEHCHCGTDLGLVIPVKRNWNSTACKDMKITDKVLLSLTKTYT